MASEQVMDTIEKTVDAVEETLDTIERIPKVHLNGTTKKQQYIILGVTAVFSAAAGGFTTYQVAKRKIREHYLTRSNREIAEAKKYYAMRNKRGKFSDPKKLAKKLDPSEITNKDEQNDAEDDKNEFGKGTYVEKVDTLAYTPAEQPLPTEKELLEKVVEQVEELADEVQEMPRKIRVISEDEPIGDFDYQAEMAKRTPDAPYIVSLDEYMENTPRHEQDVLTYFEDDDVVVDNRDQPVDDVQATVGEENLTKFGYGSGNADVVFVRNERLKMDFEVSHSTGSYISEILGILEHSEDRGSPRKFRTDRE